VRAMWLMLQQDEPGDYVIGTGVEHSVRELAELTFGCLDLDWQEYVVHDDRLLRPAEVEHLVADPAKAGRVLGWEPTVDFEGLVRMMVDADIELLRHRQLE
jgi:GDPmannose 4,6-dehydratase